MRAPLRRRLTLIMGAFGAALVFTYAWVVPRLVLDTEDHIFARNLARLREQAALEPERVGPLDAPGVRVIRDLAAEPPELAAFLADLDPGTYEFNDQPLPGLPTTELIVVRDAGERPFWLLYDVAGLEALEGPWSLLYLGTVGGGLLLAVSATVVGMVAARRIFRALDDLEKLVAGDAAAPSAAEARSDEIGRIARLWREADSQLRAALERERRFTRDVSHELRTPIAAAHGALELLRSEEGAHPERRAELQRRIGRALTEMGDLVHTFLWLARGPSRAHAGLDAEVFSLGDLTERLVRERSALAGARATLSLDRQRDALIEGHEALARVVLGNLLGNALEYGDGAAHVSVDGPRVSVANRTRGQRTDAEPEGFGFGLAITRDLCARSGWSLEVREDGARFTVDVILASP